MVNRGFTSWVLVAIFLASTIPIVSGDPEQPTTTIARHSQHNIYYARQLMTSSSSYDYWWPYPPYGETTATATTTTLATDTPTNTLLVSPTSTPELAFSSEVDSAMSSYSDSASFASQSSASPSASQSIISISALPPANTSFPSTSHRKLSVLPSNNLVLIIPVCAVGGLLVGGIATWCVYGCLTRKGRGGRRRGRTSYGSLEVGPEYTPPSPHDEKDDYDGEQGQWVGDEKYAQEQDNGPPDNASDGEDEQAEETEGFLHPGTAQTRTLMRDKSTATAVRAKSHRSSRAPSPTPSGRTSLFFDRVGSPTDNLPWESLRHKSIKRGILERLQDDGQQEQNSRRRPWQTHGRHDSDLLVSDAHADLSRAVTAVSRASTTATARTGAGFRILSESPAETPRSERGAEEFTWPSVEEDKYTRVPTRNRSRSPEKASRPASPSKAARRAMSPDKGRRQYGRSEDNSNDIRDILPQSPPCISSPILDDALCFTPVPSPPLPEGTPEIRSFASFGGPGME
ncbi:hypothetical protein FB45DRAFT_910139 [Roridomyces roridus]|uniref:Mid2 domain-containing protein n=1 Tax=Roridomyces roridus TaxID=1738132 RepID=A0AAD7FS03_9AGAR|nr:hypothetical protein FB45DRAFT_910139 [Roridomyces roridus]